MTYWEERRAKEELEQEIAKKAGCKEVHIHLEEKPLKDLK